MALMMMRRRVFSALMVSISFWMSIRGALGGGEELLDVRGGVTTETEVDEVGLGIVEVKGGTLSCGGVEFLFVALVVMRNLSLRENKSSESGSAAK